MLLIPVLQLLSGVLWLLPALYLSPRVVAAWRKDATRSEVLSAPIGFFAWLQVGFIVRWLVWPEAVEMMVPAEIATWAALYTLSSGCALWVFAGAIRTKGE